MQNYTNALRIAMEAHKKNDLNTAWIIYSGIVQHFPRCATAIHCMGIVAARRGRMRDALALIGHSVSLQGNIAEWHLNYGVVLRAAGQMREAECSFRRALEIKPGLSNASTALLRTLAEQGRIDALLAEIECAVSKACSSPELLGPRVFTYLNEKLPEHAVVVLRRMLEKDPSNESAKFRLAACTGEGVPLRAPIEHVKTTFRAMAAEFNTISESISIQDPLTVAHCLNRFYHKEYPVTILDIGCGTGLVGEWLHSFGLLDTTCLHGVDVSADMLEKCKETKRYDQLFEEDMVSFMGQTSEKYDYVLAAGVLSFFGDLGELFSAVREVLTSDSPGSFIFTFEVQKENKGESYTLGRHGRYTHAVDYVRKNLRDNGLTVEWFRPCNLCLDGEGWASGRAVVVSV